MILSLHAASVSVFRQASGGPSRVLAVAASGALVDGPG